jgi:hypothetical protein
VSSTEAFQRVVVHVLNVELPTTLVVTSNPDPTVEECWKSDLDVAGARSLHPVAA